MVFFANALHGRKFNDTEMPKSKTKADTDPKIPLKWLNINQVWCQRGPKCPNISQNGPDKPTLAQQRPTQTTKGKNEADGAKTANHIFCESKIGFAHAPCPPPPPNRGQSYINPLRCSSAFRHLSISPFG